MKLEIIENESKESEESNTLTHFPNTIFAVPIGLAAQASLWKTYSKLDDNVPVFESLSAVLWWVGLLALVTFVLIHIIKARVCFYMVKREFDNAQRSNYLFAPIISTILLVGSTPEAYRDPKLQNIVWWVAAVAQTCLALVQYGKWLFSDTMNVGDHIDVAYLMGVVSWFMLCIVGLQVEQSPSGTLICRFFFAVGFFFAVLVYVTTLQQLHTRPLRDRRHPRSFLMLAPLANAAVAYADLTGSFGMASQMIVGISIFLLLLLLRLGVVLIAPNPKPLGIYWAYSFPMSSVAIAATRQADALGGAFAWTIAYLTTGLSFVVFCMVAGRFSFFVGRLFGGSVTLEDPLVMSPKHEEEHTYHTHTWCQRT